MNLDFTPKGNPRQEYRKQQLQRHEHRFIGSMSHRPGLTLFAVNVKTLDVHPASYVQHTTITWNEALTVYHGGTVNRRVQIEKDCVYVEALNAENALRHFFRML